MELLKFMASPQLSKKKQGFISGFQAGLVALFLFILTPSLFARIAEDGTHKDSVPIGYLIFRERGFHDDSKARMVLVVEHEPFVAITKATTAEGSHIEVTSGLRPLFIPLPSSGIKKYDAAIFMIDSCRRRFPQFGSVLDDLESTWKRAKADADKKEKERPVAKTDAENEKEREGAVVFTLKDGTKLKNIVVLGVDAKGLRVMTDNGVQGLNASQLPRELLEKYGYEEPEVVDETAAANPSEEKEPVEAGVAPIPDSNIAAKPEVAVPADPKNPASTAKQTPAPGKVPGSADSPEADNSRLALLQTANSLLASIPPDAKEESSPFRRGMNQSLLSLKEFVKVEAKTSPKIPGLASDSLFEYLGTGEGYRMLWESSEKSGDSQTAWAATHPSKLRIVYTQVGEYLSEVELIANRLYFETYTPDFIKTVISPLSKSLLGARDSQAFLEWLDSFDANLPFESNKGVLLSCGIAEISAQNLDATMTKNLECQPDVVSIKIKTLLTPARSEASTDGLPKEALSISDGGAVYAICFMPENIGQETAGWSLALSRFKEKEKYSQARPLLGGFELAEVGKVSAALDEVAQWSVTVVSGKLTEGNYANPEFKFFPRADKSYAAWKDDLSKAGVITSPDSVLSPKDLFALRWMLYHAGDAAAASQAVYEAKFAAADKSQGVAPGKP